MTLHREIIRQTIDLMKHVDTRKNRRCELSPLQLRTLIYVKDRECVKSTDISKEFNVTPATVTAQIDKLVQGGWLRRCSDGNDRRIVNISLTKKSDRELENMIEETVKQYDWVFKVLSNEEQETLHSLLVKVHEYAHNVNGNRE